MRLIRCHIDNFGKLCDQEIDFCDGLNVINQPNAWGKSTLAAFFKAMFYGFDSKKEARAIAKDRDLYRPWQGGTYGGELDFEVNGKKYRVVRTFAKSEKGDEFHLYDLDTNLESKAFSSNLGGELFDLDGASFKRSIYIAQNDCVSESSDAINAKLGNLVENTNDINNFESAIKVLKDTMNSMSPDRVTGSIKRRKSIITGLEQKLRSYDSAKEQLEAIETKLGEKQNQKAEMVDYRQQYAQALRVASEEQAKTSRREHYAILKQDVKAAAEQVKQYENAFPKGIPTEETFTTASELIHRLQEQKTTDTNFTLSEEEQDEYNKLQTLFDRGVPTEEQIEQQVSNLTKTVKVRKDILELDSKISYVNASIERQELDYKPKSTKKTGMVVLATILEIIGVMVGVVPFVLPPSLNLFPIAQIVGCVIIVLGLIVLVLASILEKNAKRLNEEHEEEKEKYLKPVEELESRMLELTDMVQKQEDGARVFLERYHIFCMPDNYQARLYELKGMLTEYHRYNDRLIKVRRTKEIVKELEDTLRNVLASMGLEAEDNYAQKLAEFQSKITEYRIATKALDEKIAKQKAFEEQYDLVELSTVAECPYSLDELNEMISKVDEKIEEIRGTIEQLTHQRDELQKQFEQKEETEQELALSQELQEHELHQYEILRLTSEFLQNSKEQFTSRYMAPISGGFEKYYGMLTGDTERNWQVDANIEVKVKEHGQLHETKYLSAGYQDLIGVCMRLALVEAMYQEEKPFLILDDPFVNLDDQKIIKGKQMLESVAKEYQTIYFTCHESRTIE